MSRKTLLKEKLCIPVTASFGGAVAFNYAFWFEFFCVLSLSFTAGLLQVFACGLPNLSLLFDSQGYLWVAESVQKACNKDVAALLCNYIGGGFVELDRLNLRQSISGMADICKTGPVLTVYLASVYALLGKPLISANWQLAAISMVSVTALSVGGIWFWARLLFGVGVARIAVFICLTYSGLMVNAGRPLSELPLILLTAWLAFAFWQVTTEEWRAGVSLRRSATARFASGLVLGGLLALLMLARPTMILLPGFLIVVALIVAKLCRKKNPFSLPMIFGLLLSSVLVLAPWALCKQVFTGTPSLTVDRYGSWNIFAGNNLVTDGWDMLPAEEVSHPDRFKLSMGAAVAHVFTEAQSRPLEYINLLLRKPARLLDAPWNDFQLPLWGISFPLQRFWHQVILLAACLGFCRLFQRAWKDKNSETLLAAFLLGGIIAYQLTSCAFITMSRYFAASIPCLVILAAYGLSSIHAELDLRKRFVFLLSLVSAPLLSFIFSSLYAGGSSGFCDLALEIGLNNLGLFCALLISLMVMFSVYVCFAGEQTKAFRISKKAVCLGVLAAVCCFASSLDQFFAFPGPIQAGNSKDNALSLSVDLPATSAQQQFFLVLDPCFVERKMRTRNSPVPFDAEVEINGKQQQLNWLPLLAWDLSQRENLSYATAFAYSSGCRISDFRQWYCTAIPAAMLKEGQSNIFRFSSSDDSNRLSVSGDFVDENNVGHHNLSLREFSWSKGFFANNPGEMRANVWQDRLSELKPSLNFVGRNAWLRPRAMLIAVDPRLPGCDLKNVNGFFTNLPDQHIDSSLSRRMSVVQVDRGSYSSSLKEEVPFALHIRVDGRCRTRSGKGMASVALVESIEEAEGAKEGFAPLAPLKIEVGEDWQEFSFDDLISCSGSPSMSLPSLRLLFLARPWWEALNYAQYKGTAPVQFDKLSLRIFPEPLLNLDTQPYNIYPFQIHKSVATNAGSGLY